MKHNFGAAPWRVGCFCVALVTGCLSHVNLSVPPPDAPLATRAEAYRQLHATSAVQTITSMQGAGTSFDNTLKLANGTSVSFVEDILPVVPERSESAEYARGSLSKRDKAHVCGWVSALSTVAFGALVFGLVSSSGSGNRTFEKAALATTGLSAAGFGIANYLFLNSSSNDAMDAYRYYNDGLQKKLSICVGADCGSQVIRDTSESDSPSRGRK